MLSALDIIGLAFALTDEKPKPTEGMEPNSDIFTKNLQNWEHANKVCRHIILSTLSNELFDVYCSYKEAREIWDSMNKKYILEDAGTQKFAIGNFLNYQMTNSKDVSVSN